MRRYLETTLATLMARDVQNPETIHLKNALLNQQTARPPVGYVEELFDDYAERFDVHLVEKLNYQVPQLVSSVVNRHLGHQGSSKVLDLGCGTGLVAAQLDHSRIDSLIGVDLSQKMLDKASERGVYHELVKQDIVDYLATCTSFDIIIIADTLVYLGDLQDVFLNITQRLSTAGKLIFTVERYQDATELGYHLQHTGRYAHRQDYIEGLLTSSGLKDFHVATVQLRQGAGSWVDGLLFVVSV
jgi:predicted TPR repeat methyltransferase